MSSQLYFLPPQSSGGSGFQSMTSSNHGAGTNWQNSHDFASNDSILFPTTGAGSSTSLSFPTPANVDAGPSDLMRIPEHKKLYNEYRSLTAMSIQMFQENHALKMEVMELKVEIESLKRNGDTGPYGAAARRQTSHSVAPSDSISQQPSCMNTALGFLAPPAAGYTQAPPTIDYVQAKERPDKYPFEVLWFKRNCRDDTDACPSDSNPSRPPMKKAIRDEKGDMILEDYYESILKSAALYVNELVLLVYEKAPRQAPRKSYIKKHFPAQWRNAIKGLEGEHPVLALCAAHWKADQLLSEMLRSRKAGSEITEGKNHTNDPSSSKRKRGDSIVQTNQQKKRKNEHNTSDSECENNNESRGLSPGAVGADLEPSASFEPENFTAAIVIPPTPNLKGKAKAGLSFDDLVSQTHALASGKLTSSQTKMAPPQALARPNIASSSVQPLPEPSVLSMINVEATYSDLKDVSTQEFSTIPRLLACLEQLQKVSKSEAFNAGEPCSSTLALLVRIEEADPTMPNIDEDDTNVGWGHIQFTAGGITLTTVICSWKNIGNVATAYRLLAAAIKTCRVARHLCYTNDIAVTGGYLSDSYLQNLVELIWDMLKMAEPGQANPPTTSVGPHEITAPPLAPRFPPSSQSSEDRPLNTTTPQPASPAATNPKTSDLVQDLQRDELKKWIQTKNIAMPTKQNKQDLIDAIRESKVLPNAEEVKDFVNQRKKKQPIRRGKGT